MKKLGYINIGKITGLSILSFILIIRTLSVFSFSGELEETGTGLTLSGGIIKTSSGDLIEVGTGSLEETGTGDLSDSGSILEERQKEIEKVGRILNNFKGLQYEMLFETQETIDREDLDVFDSASKANILTSIKDKVKNKKEELQDSKENITRRITSLEETISGLDDDIATLTLNISNSSIKIIKLRTSITQHEEEIEVLMQKIEENRKILLDYVIHLYKKGNIVLGEGQDMDSIKTILLGGGNLGDILSDLYFKGIIEVTGQKLVEKHRAYIGELFLKKLNLGKQIEIFKKVREKYLQDKKDLNSKKAFREKILELSKGRESIFQKEIEEKIMMEKRLKIKALKEKMTFNTKQTELLEKYGCEEKTGTGEIDGRCEEVQTLLKVESKLKPFFEKFDWPLEEFNGITSYFGDKSYEEQFGASHDAIDLRAEQGTEIKSPASAYVLFVQEPVNEGYSYVALKHADGFVTVYGHLSEVMVKKYDYLEAGAVFAKTGGEVGTNGAGYMTTGPHLHMEVFKDKEVVDPLNYFDLSSLELSDLPNKKYVEKFYNDYKEKFGKNYKAKNDNARVFVLEGNTEVERQKYLLNKYAVGSFRSWNLWVEEGLEGKIDPTFLMCIGLAETGLGKNLKTPFNVGNIGNTDSGATRDFPNARSGIYWMVKTLNNKYLGEYNKLYMLSRYGNADGAIYASSSDHWHNNIVRCMSAVKDREIYDDHNFRLNY